MDLVRGSCDSHSPSHTPISHGVGEGERGAGARLFCCLFVEGGVFLLLLFRVTVKLVPPIRLAFASWILSSVGILQRSGLRAPCALHGADVFRCAICPRDFWYSTPIPRPLPLVGIQRDNKRSVPPWARWRSLNALPPYSAQQLWFEK